jgi:hypothetical protein
MALYVPQNPLEKIIAAQRCCFWWIRNGKLVAGRMRLEDFGIVLMFSLDLKVS